MPNATSAGFVSTRSTHAAVPDLSEDDFQWTGVSNLSLESPGCLADEALAYDPQQNYTVLFGGRPGCTSDGAPSNQTWTYSANEWTNLTGDTGVTRPARLAAEMVYDPEGGFLLMFGGQTSNTPTDNETWVFSGGEWTNLRPIQSPSPRLSYAMDYAPTSGCVLLFGGLILSTNAVLSDTWCSKGGEWTNLTSGIAPPGPKGSWTSL